MAKIMQTVVMGLVPVLVTAVMVMLTHPLVALELAVTSVVEVQVLRLLKETALAVMGDIPPLMLVVSMVVVVVTGANGEDCVSDGVHSDDVCW